MKWLTIKKLHVNMNNVDGFKWEDGNLYVFFSAESNPAYWEDPDRELYLTLCLHMGAEPVTMED